MGKVIVLESVNDKLNSLVLILFENGYFGFVESALNYVEKIHVFILSIPNQQHYQTNNPRFGAYYSKFKPNKNTTYYITFDIIEDYYFVQNVITNHTPDYPIYIKE